MRGKPVENEAVLGVRLVNAGIDDADDDIVGDQLARLHDRLCLKSDLRARGDGGAEHVTCRELGDVVFLHEPRGLGTFSGPGRPEQINLIVVSP